MTTDQPTENSSSRTVSWTFITAGLTLAGIIIVILGITRLPYRTDPNFPIPTLDKIDEYMNQETIDITGEGIPGETLVLYTNGKQQHRNVTVNDIGYFSFDDVELDEEEKLRFEVATVRGTLFKKRSEKSNELVTTIDRTPPSDTVDLEYFKNSDTEVTTIKGKAESSSYVIFNKGYEKYETETNEDGTFEITDMKLESGENIFNVSIRDKAGNRVDSPVTAEILYDPIYDINGNAVTSQANGKLPESAGELEAALNFIAGNKIMLLMGTLALLGLVLSSTAVYTFKIRTVKK